MRNRPDALMLFAAGFGTRMAPLTDRVPKPLIEVAGKPLIDHALELTRNAGLSRIVANTHYRADMVEAHLRGRAVEVLRETPDILDTGGGLKHALPRLGGGAVFTLNTDAVWTGSAPLERLRDAWDPARMDALLLVVRPGDAVGHTGGGDFTMCAEGRLTRGPGYVYSGLQIVDGARVAEQPERVFSLNAVWTRLQAEGRLFGLVHDGRWCDVGQPASINLAERLLADQSHV